MATINSTLKFQDEMSSRMESIARKLEMTAAEAEIAKTNLNQLEYAQRQWKMTLDNLKKAQIQDKDAIASAREEYLKALKAYDDGVLKVNKYEQEIKKLKQQEEELSKKTKDTRLDIIALSSAFQLFNQVKGIISGVNSKINEFVGYTRTQMQAEDQLSIITKQRMALNDEQVRSLYDLASAQQKLGVVGDEATISAMSGLAAFTKQKSSIEALTPAMNNLAVKMYGYNVTAENMDMISKSLGKAMLGDVGALSRMGIKIDDVTKKRLMSLKEEERAIELSKLITSVTGNMNEEMAKTPFGQMAQAQNRLGDSYEKLGAALLPFQAQSAEVWSNIVETIVKHLDYLVPVITVALGAVAIAFTVMKWEAITAWLSAIAPVAAVIGAIAGVSLILKTLGVDFATQGKAIMNIFFMIANIVQDVGILVANFFRSMYNGAINVINLVRRARGEELLEKKEYTDLKGWKNATQTTDRISKSLKGGLLTNRSLLGTTGSGVSSKNGSLDGLTTNTSGGKALKTQNQGDISLKDDDISLLHDLATRDYAQYFQQLTPNLTIPSMVIHETADVNQVIGAIANAVTGTVSSSTSGGYATI